jgi:hypothetical protein
MYKGKKESNKRINIPVFKIGYLPGSKSKNSQTETPIKVLIGRKKKKRIFLK